MLSVVLAAATHVVSGASPQTTASPPEVFSFESAGMQLQVEEVHKADGVVWAMDFIDEQTMVFTLRDGQLQLMDLQDFSVTSIPGAPEVQVSSSGGLFDVMVDPDFENNRQLYFTYVKAVAAGGATVAARGRLKDGRVVGLEDLFVANNASDELAHFGSRIVMDDDRFIYITVGDRHIPNNAQNLSSHGGKVIRLHDDGRVPESNPFAGRDDAAPEIWTFGHRNPQGLTIDPASGRIFEQEHGPTGGDEINILVRATNYGWPVITYGKNLWGGQEAEGTAREGMQQPFKYWVPGNAPTGLNFLNGDRYPGWQGNLFVATLRGPIERIQLEDGVIVAEERLSLKPMDRIRDIVSGPDGLLYFATESGRIARIVPQGN